MSTHPSIRSRRRSKWRQAVIRRALWQRTRPSSRMVGATLRNMAAIGESLIRDNVALRQRCRGYEGNFGLDRLVWTLEIRIEKIAHALFAFFAGRFARLRWAKKQGSRLIQRRLNFGQRGINLEPCLFAHSGRQC